jgi:hypothetical protein
MNVYLGKDRQNVRQMMTYMWQWEAWLGE